MSETIENRLDVVNDASDSIIILDADRGMISAGAENESGLFILNDERGQPSVQFNAAGSEFRLGTTGNDGDLRIVDSNNSATISCDGNGARMALGANGVYGKVDLYNDQYRRTVELRGQDGSLTLGGVQGVNGAIFFHDERGNSTVTINGATANIRLGGNRKTGDIELVDGADRSTINLSSHGARVSIGAAGSSGDLNLIDQNARTVFDLRAGTAAMEIGTAGNSGSLSVNNTNGREAITVNGHSRQLIVRNALGGEAVILDGDSGDIVLNNADFAEDFDIQPAIAKKVEKGTVMVFTETGSLKECDHNYDPKVAGVISGAGKYKPGIVMDKQEDSENRLPVALSGKVMVKADASSAPIQIGDLLTTSSLKGHARKVTDASQALGAVIGKAMSGLDEGTGMISMLVALQ